MSAEDTKVLRKILKLDATDKSANNSEIDELLEEHEVPKFKTTMATLTNWCESLIRQKKNRPPLGLFTLIGKVMDHHTPHPSAMSAYAQRLTRLRRAITDTYGAEKGKAAIKESKISNSGRTIEKNQIAKAVRDNKHENAFSISLDQIEEICKKMIDDIEDGSTAAQRNAIVLLVELCLGCRVGEVIMASEFSLMESKKIGNRTVQFIRQKGVLKKREPREYTTARPTGSGQAGEGSDADPESEDEELDEEESDMQLVQAGGASAGANAVLEKPVLPYVDAAFLLSKLAEWRSSQNIVPGHYVEKTVRKYNTRMNKLLRAKYLDPKDYKDVRIKTHLLRSIYAAAAYQLFSRANQTLNSFIHEHLGHSNLETGLSYAYVKIIDGKKPILIDDSDEPAVPAGDGMEMDDRPMPQPQPILPSEFNSYSQVAEMASLRAEVQGLRKDMGELISLVKLLLNARDTQKPADAPIIPAVLPAPLPSRDDNVAAPETRVLRRSARIKT